MRKVNLILGIIAILLGLMLFLIDSPIFAVILLLIGALNVYAGVRKPKPEPETAPTTVKKEICAFTVAGFDYYQDALKEFLYRENPEYSYSKSDLIDMEDERIYEYEPYIGYPDLVPEPDNKYDSNAIAVLLEGTRVGYVPRNYQESVAPYLTDDSVSREIEIYGGKYKVLQLGEDYDERLEPKASDYTITRDSTPYKASVRLYTML